MIDGYNKASHIKNHIKEYHKHRRCPELTIDDLLISYHGDYHYFQVETNNIGKFINLIENDLNQYKYEIINPDDEEYCAVQVYSLIDDL